jgi:Cdc6-like AAA superfamily ATPase
VAIVFGLIFQTRPVIVTGPSGAGKSCISQCVTERLREEVRNVETTYVNCWRNYTRFRTLYQILDDLGATIDIHRRRRTTNSSTDLSNMTASACAK